jgi:hypothetical protein
MVNIDNSEVLRGTTARPPGRFNYDKPRQSRVILIMGRENFSFLSLRWEIFTHGEYS